MIWDLKDCHQSTKKNSPTAIIFIQSYEGAYKTKILKKYVI